MFGASLLSGAASLPLHLMPLIVALLGGQGRLTVAQAGWIEFGSDLDQSMWGAGSAFVVVAIVSVILTYMTQPKPIEELQGLVYGMANIDDSVKRPPHWWESPKLLAGFVLAGATALTILFW